MKKFNEMYVIGIDHGYGNMKTANCCFPTGVMKSDTEPTFVSTCSNGTANIIPSELVTRSLRRTSIMTMTIMFSPLPPSHGSYGENASPRLPCSSPQDYP